MLALAVAMAAACSSPRNADRAATPAVSALKDMEPVFLVAIAHEHSKLQR
jgi:hypothetical protein